MDSQTVAHPPAETVAANPTPPPVGKPSRPRLGGYAPLDFQRLSGFVFDLDQAVREASPTNLQYAIAQTLRQIPTNLLALDHHPVSLEGFVLPLRLTNGLCTEFLLMRDQSMCCFGKLPRINEWVAVVAPAGFKAELDRPQVVSGKFEVGDFREEGRLVGLYRLTADHVVSRPRAAFFRDPLPGPAPAFPLERTAQPIQSNGIADRTSAPSTSTPPRPSPPVP